MSELPKSHNETLRPLRTVVLGVLCQVGDIGAPEQGARGDDAGSHQPAQGLAPARGNSGNGQGPHDFFVTLPWPPSTLNPNARLHYQALARAKKSYRHACTILAMQAGAREFGAAARGYRLDVLVSLVPPDKRARDTDNMVASLKAGLDGLADALRIDDRHFNLKVGVSDQIGGFVKVYIQPDTASGL